MKYALIPTGNDTFRIEEKSHFRIQFLFKNDRVVAIDTLKEDGSSNTYNINK